uniref:GAF domain-containing protein n=1 Tax=Magnetococcus massalia (strain MO-1) TaxID=451514 RepID=A0A1S7LM92_MAGMO|nr:conserved protein of unknown function [Candidatus Magnetococcus massalia]
MLFKKPDPEQEKEKGKEEEVTIQEQADAITAITASTRVLGVRVSALVELAIFYAIMFALDYGLGGGNRFMETTPHPFWFIVLVISIQYGTTEGLLAAFFSTLALRVMNVPEPAFNQEVFDYILSLMRQPMMWFMAAVIMGELRVRQHRFQMELRDTLVETRKREDLITDAYNRVNRVKEALETRAAGQMRTVVSSIQAAKSVEQQEPTMVYSGASDIVQTVLNPKKFSLYALEEGVLNLKVNRGWTPEDKYKQKILGTDPIYQRAVGEKKFLAVTKPDQREALDREGVMAGPLLNKETGAVAGMMKIEELGFMDLNVSTVENFRALCEWIGTSLDNANRYQEAKSDSVLNHEHQLFSFGFFPKQVQIFTSLAMRLKFEVCLLIIRLENADDLNLEERRKIPATLSQACQTVMRTTDMAFDYERPGYEFALLLPATPVDNLHFVTTKLDTAIEEIVHPVAPRSKFSVQIQILHQLEKKEDEEKKEQPAPADKSKDGGEKVPAEAESSS